MKKNSGLISIFGVIAALTFTFLFLNNKLAKQDEYLQALREQKVSEQELVEQETSSQPESASTRIPVELVKTIDGDTIKIIYEGERINVRYLLVDTPETSHPRLGKQPFGDRATERNRELMNSGKLEIEFDIGERIDKYGRLLAYIYIDGESVQEKLIEEGLARVGYIYPPNTRHLDAFEEAQERAKKAGIGIWSLEDYVTDRGFNGKSKSD